MAVTKPPSATTTPQAQKAQALIGEYNARVAEIRTSGRYTPDGLREAINSLYQEAHDEVAALRADVRTQRDTRTNELRTRIFGGKTLNSNDVISFRDAQERVSALKWNDHQKAEKLLEQAELVGDIAMAQAVLQRAVDEKWSGIAHKYVEHHPAQEADLEEYWALTAGGISGDTMMAAAAFYLPKPPEA